MKVMMSMASGALKRNVHLGGGCFSVKVAGGDVKKGEGSPNSFRLMDRRRRFNKISIHIGWTISQDSRFTEAQEA